jgi:hypothetical protein
VAKRLRGYRSFKSIVVMRFLEISYFSMLESVPDSLLYPPKMYIMLSSNKQADA